MSNNISEIMFPASFRLLPGPCSLPTNAQTSNPISAVCIAVESRFGNSVRQYANAFNVTRLMGLETIYMPAFSWIRQGVHILSNELIIVNKKYSIFDDESMLLVSKFLRNPSYPKTYRKLSAYEVINKSRGILEVGTDLIPLAEDHLVIHIRSGDVFVEIPMSGYGQPPLAFYLKIIESESWELITIVAEDDGNPVLRSLREKYAQDSRVKVFTNRPLSEDLELLFRAVRLVSSNGTFCRALSAISVNLKWVYAFENTFSHWGNRSIRVIKYVDADGEYRKSILNKNWQNKFDQLILMIKYEVEKISRVNDN